MTSHVSVPPSTGGAHRLRDADSLPPSRLAGRRVVAVVFSSYPADPRPRRAAEALAREGASVEVICLKETDEEPTRERFHEVEIMRLPLKRRRGGKLTYLLQYGSFILSSATILAFRAIRRRYDLVHIHNMPDFLVFSALGPKMLGARVILDLHDPMPELMMAIFKLPERSISVRLLKGLERWSLYFADSAVTVNEACRRIFSDRSCPARKVAVVMNAPDEDIFPYREAQRTNLTQRHPQKPFVIMYHGSLVERHGLDLAVTALSRICESIPEAELRIYGRSTPFLEKVMESVKDSTLREKVHYLGPKTLAEIGEAIRQCDVGIIPNRRSVFTELNTPTRIFEYLSQGKPVLAPRSRGILDYFSEDELCFFDLGDIDELAAKLQFLFAHPEEAADLVVRGQTVYRAHVWSVEKERFLCGVTALLEPR